MILGVRILIQYFTVIRIIGIFLNQLQNFLNSIIKFCFLYYFLIHMDENGTIRKENPLG